MSETLVEGRYRVRRTLGHGGMALVYLAEDRELRREVAVKVLAEHLAADETFRERFLREARLAAQLAHPNIVQVYDAGESDSRPYIVMEYVRGETLSDVLRRRRRLPATAAIELAAQACRGLQHAHDAGLVHRDIKPQNLLLREDGTLKIADFGIARATEATRITQVGMVLGTAAYLAPEQAAAENVTAAADIYSLGAVLYELLTGRPPAASDGVVKPVRDVERSVPEPLEAVVMRCLARDARFRPASAAELERELLHDERTTEPFPARTFRSIPGSGAWLWIVAAVVVATIAALLGLLSVGGDGSSTKRPRPVRVAPPARGATPADEARNLAAWLRRHARR